MCISANVHKCKDGWLDGQGLSPSPARKPPCDSACVKPCGEQCGAQQDDSVRVKQCGAQCGARQGDSVRVRQCGAQGREEARGQKRE
eukprot:339335-Chlamydomonas_euryale.AAC.4